MNRFLILGTLLLGIAGGSRPALAIDCQTLAPQVAAAAIDKALQAAYEKLKADYGADIFLSRRGDVETKDGFRTIGQVWGDELAATAYPSATDDRKTCASRLSDAGLTNQGAFLLVYTPADYDSYEALRSALSAVIRGSAK